MMKPEPTPPPKDPLTIPLILTGLVLAGVLGWLIVRAWMDALDSL